MDGKFGEFADPAVDRDRSLGIDCRLVERCVHASPPTSDRTSSETRMCDMIPLTEATQRTKGCELAIKEDIALRLALPALVRVGLTRGLADCGGAALRPPKIAQFAWHPKPITAIGLSCMQGQGDPDDRFR
jgi:hypothetical protein